MPISNGSFALLNKSGWSGGAPVLSRQRRRCSVRVRGDALGVVARRVGRLRVERHAPGHHRPGRTERAAAYKVEHGLEATILCDPDHDLCRAYGIGRWQFQQIKLSDPLREYLDASVGWAAAIQQQRRESGRPLVDDPWRATAEFVIGTDGVPRFAHAYEHCYDPPTPDVLIAGAG
jgi:DNA-directed RNA polymerase subunit H (RpoH/RPB5)